MVIAKDSYTPQEPELHPQVISGYPNSCRVFKDRCGVVDQIAWDIKGQYNSDTASQRGTLGANHLILDTQLHISTVYFAANLPRGGSESTNDGSVVGGGSWLFFRK